MKWLPLRKIPTKWNDFHQKERFQLKGVASTKMNGFRYIGRLPLKGGTSTKTNNSNKPNGFQ